MSKVKVLNFGSRSVAEKALTRPHGPTVIGHKAVQKVKLNAWVSSVCDGELTLKKKSLLG